MRLPSCSDLVQDSHRSPDESKGFFANKVLLVEGATEYYALPELMKKLGHSLTQAGVEIVMARGKNSIPLYWRLFRAFDIPCACLFDGDRKGNDKKASKKANDELGNLLGIDVNGILLNAAQKDIYIQKDVAFFSKDFETFMRNEVPEYVSRENECRDLGIQSKPGVARAVCKSLETDSLPPAFNELWDKVIEP
jgi:putative ATP-dependent endonuclease of OLD family